MSREIKFRAWDIEAKAMRHIIMGLGYALHGLIACEWCDSATLENHWLRNDADCVGGKDRFILMQYTGEHGKDDVELWQHDWVKCTWENGLKSKGMIDYYHGAWRVLANDGTYDYLHRLTDMLNEHKPEVIGDIHTTPKLMEDK